MKKMKARAKARAKAKAKTRAEIRGRSAMVCGARLFALMTALVAGCSGLGSIRDPRVVAADEDLGWRALAEGRDVEAAADFRARLGRDPGDVPALFGDASLAFERGDSARATASYVALLERATGVPDEWTGLLAAMAIGRVSTLLDEHPGPGSDRAGIENRLLAISPERLPWEARYDLALLGDRLGRRRGDPEMLERVSRAAGCLRAFTVGRPAGTLPHVDLDSVPAGTDGGRQQRPGRTVEARGCVVSVPAFDGRAGAARIFADIEVPGGGTYDVVLDFQGEARLIIDGGPAYQHGGETRYGPRVSAARVALSPGRHELELRLAMFGGHPNVVVMVIPANPDGDRHRGPDHDNRRGPVASPSVIDAVSSPAQNPPGSGLLAAAELAAAYVANRDGDVARAWAVVERLQARRRFALGLAFAAAVAREDPSRPANFGRDRARTLLSEAVAVDPALGRARHALAMIALDNDRPREALDEALAATRASPGWWPAELTLHAAYRSRGLEWDADRALDQALSDAPGACAVVEAALGRAEDRRDLKSEARLGAALDACGKDSDEQIERMRRKGDLAGVEAALRRIVALGPDRDEAKMDLASVLLARGDASAAAKLIAAVVRGSDGDGQIRLADALASAGAGEQAKMTIATALERHPDMPEIVRAARALGLPLPLDAFRLDGRHVIRQFENSGHHYAAPAVIVLDRTVARIFPSGAEMVLTHEIVRVQSKDAIEKWGETRVPERTEILVLRTHKADGSTREPEEFAGKESISAADLAVGDYVEKETLEMRAPRDAFVGDFRREMRGEARAHDAPADDVAGGRGGGYLGDRFYFQSFDAPLDRSEYLVVTTAAAARKLSVDRRAGAPASTQAPGPSGQSNTGAAGAADADGTDGTDGTIVTTFAASQMPQLFAERSSVPAIEHVPSVRVSIGVGWAAWSRFLREQLYGTLRASPVLQRVADQIAALAPGASLEARAASLVAWVGQNIEADDDLRDPASFSVTRGRGNRVAVILALARLLGLDARPVLARSRLTADGGAPALIEEADDFADPLVRFELPGHGVVYVDPRLKHAPFGYLPPGLDGARTLVLATAKAPDRAVFEIAHGRGGDHRAVDMEIQLDGEGAGVAQVNETLRGWPALEWAEIVDRVGQDATKLRQDFEQRWLGVHFPGAVLKDLTVEIVGPDGGPAVVRVAGTAPGTVSVTARSQSAGGVTPTAPYTAAETRLHYSFGSTRLALKRDHEIRFLPTFFRSQPGRRYAAEPRRATTLLTGFDVPLDLRARVRGPSGARFVEPPASSTRASTRVVARSGGYRFVEERKIEGRLNPTPVLLLNREARLSLMRVSPQEYPSIADELRRVDALEQEDVRIEIEPAQSPGRP